MLPFGISPVTLLARLIVLLVVMPIHEWAHAWSAHQLGDDTASLQGRMTLNPIAHLDLWGGLLILFTGFGWAQPVPVNPYRMRTPPRTGMALSALAGPMSNFLTAMLCAVPFRLGWLSITSALSGTRVNLPTLVFMVAQVSLGLGLFNLLPLYPLDGEKVLMGVLPREWGDRLMDIQPISPFILMALLFVLPMIGLNIICTLIGAVMWPLLLLLFFL